MGVLLSNQSDGEVEILHMYANMTTVEAKCSNEVSGGCKLSCQSLHRSSN